MRNEIASIVGDSDKLNHQQMANLSYYVQNLKQCFENRNLKGKFLDQLKQFENLNLTEKEKEKLDLGLQAREQMFLFNQKLVGHFAKRHQNRSLPIDDLIQIGYIGLMQAVERFDGSKNYKFSTFAYWWIDSEIKKQCAKNDSKLSISTEQPRRLYRISKIVERYQSEYGRTPTLEEIASELKVSVNTVKTSLNNNYQVVSLEIDDVESTGEKFKKSELLVGSDDPFLDIIQNESKEYMEQTLEKYLNKLPKTVRAIIIDYYYSGKRPKEVAKKYNMNTRKMNKIIQDYLEYLRFS
jgi:RNA polymerase sigma factor (sigma-70 family)